MAFEEEGVVAAGVRGVEEGTDGVRVVAGSGVRVLCAVDSVPLKVIPSPFILNGIVAGGDSIGAEKKPIVFGFVFGESNSFFGIVESKVQVPSCMTDRHDRARGL